MRATVVQGERASSLLSSPRGSRCATVFLISLLVPVAYALVAASLPVTPPLPFYSSAQRLPS